MAAKRDALALPGNRFRFGMILRAHQDVTTGPWSLDMVRAVRRQQRFSSKIAAQLQHGGVHRIYHLHTEVLVQYPKFLAMLVVKPHISLVPTTSIDLAWHTHQLFPSKYTSHTMALAGHVVNHDDPDDAVSEERIAESAKAMPEAWMEVYDEDYIAPNVSCATGDKYKVDSLDYHDVTHIFPGADTTGIAVLCGGKCDAPIDKDDAAGAAQCRNRCSGCAVLCRGRCGYAAADTTDDAAGAAQCRNHCSGCAVLCRSRCGYAAANAQDDAAGLA